ncbi:unnamed protein product [Gongylonema pulchrum]|uniref:Secreted protein n=1 Tax=Gongylonema pulchrum TaxID=637853 RepID=A0A183E4Q8_9BILA|nr:unnamed protein product [Gongylonema pulchrum]
MSVFHVTLMIWAVHWVAPDTVLHSSTPATSESGSEQLHIVESDFNSEEGASSNSEDHVIVTDSEDIVIIPLGNGSYAEADENTYADLDSQCQPIDLFATACPNVDNSRCILEMQNRQEETAVNSYSSTVTAEEAADAMNVTPNRLGKKQFDDNGDLPEENRTLNKKFVKSYIWMPGVSAKPVVSKERNTLRL